MRRSIRAAPNATTSDTVWRISVASVVTTPVVRIVWSRPPTIAAGPAKLLTRIEANRLRASCHVEHRGRADLARAADDRACVACHQFPSLGRHPEFAAVTAGRATGIGLKFNHDRHLLEVQKESGRRCEVCHQPTADLGGFEPMDFDTHCASCHTSDGVLAGETDPVDGRMLSPVPAGGGPSVTIGARGLAVVSRMAHRDPWVMANLNALRRIVDPEGERAERLALADADCGAVERLPVRPLAAMSLADLERIRDALAGEKTALTEPPQPGARDVEALRGMTTATLAVAVALNAIGSTAGDVAPVPPASESADDGLRHFEARRTELLALLDAVSARGDASLTARASALRARVVALGCLPRRRRPPSSALLGDRLRALDGIFRESCAASPIRARHMRRPGSPRFGTRCSSRSMRDSQSISSRLAGGSCCERSTPLAARATRRSPTG